MLMPGAGAEVDFKAKLAFEGLDVKTGTEGTVRFRTNVQNQLE